MESRIPLPTDNIYKFYALFGLLLFVFALGAGIYNVKSKNTFMVAALVDLGELKATAAPSPRDILKRQILERQIEVAKSDAEFFKWALAILAGFGASLMGFGFLRWHTRIQPGLDELADLQLQRARYEMRELTRSVFIPRGACLEGVSEGASSLLRVQ